MSTTEIGKSFFQALRGIKITLKTQKHLHLHIFIFILLIYVIIFGKVGLEDSLILIGISCMVIIAEMINSAIELLCDFVTLKHHEYIRNVKDISAGAVLLATFSALIIAYIILANPLILSINIFKIQILKLPLISFFITLFFFLLISFLYNIKIYKKRTIPFSYLSFSISFIVSWLILESLSVTIIFLLIIGGIILIEAILRMNKSDKVYFSGIFGIIISIAFYKIFHLLPIEINNLAIQAFSVGISPLLGSAYLSVFHLNINLILISLIGELSLLLFLLYWGKRFKSIFISDNKSNPSKIKVVYFFMIFFSAASPLPFSGALAASILAVAFNVSKIISILAAILGIVLKIVLSYYACPLYQRLGN